MLSTYRATRQQLRQHEEQLHAMLRTRWSRLLQPAPQRAPPSGPTGDAWTAPWSNERSLPLPAPPAMDSVRPAAPPAAAP